MSQTSRPAVRYALVRSVPDGAPAHFDQLSQLLAAPEDYWRSQTPIPFRPVTRFALDAGSRTLGELTLDETRVTPAHVETLLVLMAARMPFLSVEIRIDGAPDNLRGLRLVRGKLEAAREVDGETVWKPIPHHSTLIGSK